MDKFFVLFSFLKNLSNLKLAKTRMWCDFIEMIGMKSELNVDHK